MNKAQLLTRIMNHGLELTDITVFDQINLALISITFQKHLKKFITDPKLLKNM